MKGLIGSLFNQSKILKETAYTASIGYYILQGFELP